MWKDSRQGLVIIDEVGHAKEFLDCLHHFGRFCSEQLAVQNQDLQGARQGDAVSPAPSPTRRGHRPAAHTGSPCECQSALVFTCRGCWKMKCK